MRSTVLKPPLHYCYRADLQTPSEVGVVDSFFLSARPAPGAGVRRCPARRPERRILVVEDDELTQDLLCEVLRGAGHAVEAVANGREALERLRRTTVPDLILLDLMMPVLDGWGFCACQAADPVLASIPVIILSAAPDGATNHPPQAVGYLAKPITIDALLDAVHLC